MPGAGLPSALRDDLVYEPAPGLSAPVPQHDSETIRDAGDGAAIRVAECIPNRFVTHLLRRTSPDIAKFVSQPKMVSVPEAVQASTGGLFLEIEETTGNLAVHSASFEDTLVDHRSHYQDFRFS
jgi:hypothetical protein